MKCKYNNSLYSEIPPNTNLEISEPKSPNEILKEQIDEHLDEENYFIENIKFEIWLEEKEIENLIKNENAEVEI